MEGASKDDGEIKGLIQAMWDTNCNLMELLIIFPSWKI